MKIVGSYSGFGWFTLGTIFGVGAHFGIYEILTAFYKDSREDNYVYVSEALMAGMASTAVESLISSPSELIKLHGQVTSASRISSSASVKENRAVAPAIARLLYGYTPDKDELNQSVGLLSTLTSKHPNIIGAFQKYPWMMTGSGRPPSVYGQEASRHRSFEMMGSIMERSSFRSCLRFYFLRRILIELAIPTPSNA